MLTAPIRAAAQSELSALADGGATFAELLDRLDEQNRETGGSGFSDDEEQELQLYCWALHKHKSSGSVLGATALWEASEDDIGA